VAPKLWLLLSFAYGSARADMREAYPWKSKKDCRPVYFPPSVAGYNAGTYIDGGRPISRSLTDFKQISAVVRTHSPKVVE
jgi:hypothetical protein